jgi:hypothetical protein
LSSQDVTFVKYKAAKLSTVIEARKYFLTPGGDFVTPQERRSVFKSVVAKRRNKPTLIMAGLFKKSDAGKSNLTNFQRRGLADAQFSTIKDSLRKKNKEKAVSENVVMEM